MGIMEFDNSYAKEITEWKKNLSDMYPIEMGIDIKYLEEGVNSKYLQLSDYTYGDLYELFYDLKETFAVILNRDEFLKYRKLVKTIDINEYVFNLIYDTADTIYTYDLTKMVSIADEYKELLDSIEEDELDNKFYDKLKIVAEKEFNFLKDMTSNLINDALKPKKR